MADDIHIVDESGVTIVSVQEEACADIWAALQAHTGETAIQACILDFSAVSYLNSMSIASIISLRNKILTAGGKLALADLQDNIKSVFRILKLEKLFDLELDRAAANAAVA